MATQVYESYRIINAVAADMTDGYAPSQAVGIVRLAYLLPGVAVAYDSREGGKASVVCTAPRQNLYELSH